MDVTRLWWVRHGPTHEKTMVGWRDVPADLSDTAALARLNAHLPSDALLVSSDLIRAVATADALGVGRARLPHHPGLRELHFGDWDGQTWDAIAKSHPELSFAYWDDPGLHAPPGGESWNDAAARVSAATDALIAAHRGRDLILVAHFGAILTQVQRAMGCVPVDVFAHRIDNLSVTRIDHGPGGWQLGPINHCP
ncbi:histidine phosphatase family protein [Tabrizicola sp. TH137]|uniref:histidine phosphatase family protein n=1 Tax=Tabrizicola sp. TH137 TaxID=2067452 RepID=UPI000C7B0639|nr:histidine phosphatase family protein [Tabrizicola sp. TH137]PLL14029.1 histidine phosphatase family protein [Tabrizicola sp. TH137]